MANRLHSSGDMRTSLGLSGATWKGPEGAQRQEEAVLLPCRAGLAEGGEQLPHTESRLPGTL